MKTYSILLLLALLASCSPGFKYEYWDIAKFNLTEDALADGEKVKLLYSSRAPDDKEVSCYVHLIVVSQQSGDTVNVLTVVQNDFKKEDADTVFTFYGEQHAFTQITSKVQIDPEKIKDFKTEDWNNMNDTTNRYKLQRPAKVARDPKFDHVADNNFPAIIGMVGKREMMLKGR